MKMRLNGMHMVIPATCCEKQGLQLVARDEVRAIREIDESSARDDEELLVLAMCASFGEVDSPIGRG
jgi:hypothetical protein